MARFTKLLTDRKYQVGLEWMLLLAFVALASSMLILGLGSIDAR